MNAIIWVVMGLAGGFLGFLIPGITNKIIIYKCGGVKTFPIYDRRSCSLYVKALLCISNSAVWAFAGMRTDNHFAAFLIPILFSAAIIVAIIDVRIRVIPNELVLAMVVTGVAYQVLNSGLSSLLTSALCMVGMMLLFAAAGIFGSFNMIGAGDVKLAGAMGLALGYPGILTSLAIMSAALFIYCFAGLAIKKLNLRSTFAFAPFMMSGMVVSMARILVI